MTFMRVRSRFPVGLAKRSSRLLLGTVLLFAAFETVVRFKYYFDHHHDRRYLLAPFVDWSEGLDSRWFVASPQAVSERRDPNKPCQDTSLFDHARNLTLRFTYTADCMRAADPASHGRAKPRGVVRIAMIGDSTVEGGNVDDSETVPQVLEQLLNDEPRFRRSPSVRYQVVNAGFAGSTSRDLSRVLSDKVILYNPDLILFYAGFNDARKGLDEGIGQIGSVNRWAGRVHAGLYYNSLGYTYILEKYFLYAERRRVNAVKPILRVRDDFEGGFRTILAYCTMRAIPIIMIKQVISAPVVIQSVDTLGREPVQELYERQLDLGSHVVGLSVDTIVAINQRYVVSRMETVAQSYGVPVIDFVRAYDRDVPKAVFLDVVHQNADGNKRVAEYIAGAIGEHLESLKPGRDTDDERRPAASTSDSVK